jgi:hypothetical protein
VLVPASPGVVPPSLGGGGGGATGEHVPWIDPGRATQGSPAQQSALLVHVWPLIWQEVALHSSCPLAPITHGLPVQQSVAVEHAFPVATHPRPASPCPVAALQRGTPNGSSTQASNFGRAAPQQSAVELEIPQV